MIEYTIVFIINSLIVLGVFAIGYICGHHDMEHTMAHIIETAKDIKKRITKPEPSAIVYRPTAKELKKLNEPEKVKEEKEALLETFKAQVLGERK